jgi:hypothetical protein
VSQCRDVVHPRDSGIRITGQVVASPDCTVGRGTATLSVEVINYLLLAIRVETTASDDQGAVSFGGDPDWNAPSMVVPGYRSTGGKPGRRSVVLWAASSSLPSTSTLEVSFRVCEVSGANRRARQDMYLLVNI